MVSLPGIVVMVGVHASCLGTWALRLGFIATLSTPLPSQNKAPQYGVIEPYLQLTWTPKVCKIIAQNHQK